MQCVERCKEIVLIVCLCCQMLGSELEKEMKKYGVQAGAEGLR